VGGEWSALTEAVFSRIRISEVMAKNATGIQDELGEYEDWIELHNGSQQSVDLTGWTLTDDEFRPALWELPIGSILGPGETLIVWADDDEADGPLHASFQLSSEGERLLLYAPLAGASHLVDSVSFGQQVTDRSHGRMPTTGAVFVNLFEPSPGLPNEPGPGEAVGFSAVGDDVIGPSLEVSGLPFTGQVVSLDVHGFTPDSVGLLMVGRSLEAVGELLDERLGAFELTFQADSQGAAALSLLLPRWSSRLQPPQAVPAGTIFYLQAANRSVSTHGVAVCVQN